MSDVPSIIFFHNFLQNSLQKSIQFIDNFTNMKKRVVSALSQSQQPNRIIFEIVRFLIKQVCMLYPILDLVIPGSDSPHIDRIFAARKKYSKVWLFESDCMITTTVTRIHTFVPKNQARIPRKGLVIP